jgi:hypothetical protein
MLNMSVLDKITISLRYVFHALFNHTAYGSL